MREDAERGHREEHDKYRCNIPAHTHIEIRVLVCQQPTVCSLHAADPPSSDMLLRMVLSPGLSAPEASHTTELKLCQVR